MKINTGNTQEIDTFYVFLSVDENGEGILGAPLGPKGELIPLITGDERLLENLKLVAKQMAPMTDAKIRLVKYTQKEIIEELS